MVTLVSYCSGKTPLTWTPNWSIDDPPLPNWLLHVAPWFGPVRVLLMGVTQNPAVQHNAGQREFGESNTDGEFVHSALWGIKTRIVFEEDDLNSTDTCHHWWLYLNPDTFGLEEPNMVDKKVKECCNPALVPAEVLGVLYNYCQQYVHNCYGINSKCARDFSVKLVQKPIKQTMKNHIDVAVEFFWLLSISILQFIASST